MSRIEDLAQGSAVKGNLTNPVVFIVNAKWHGSGAVELTCKDVASRPENTLH
jgi:hypothetical protein